LPQTKAIIKNAAARATQSADLLNPITKRFPQMSLLTDRALLLPQV
jgi:hypothetical protein